MKKYFLVLLFLASAPFTHAQSNKDKAAENIKQALLFEENGKTEEAIKLLEETVLLDTENIIYPYELAIAYYSRQEYDKSQKVLEKLLNHKAVFGLVYQLLGNAYDKLGKPELAIKTYQAGLKRFPETGELYLELGNMYLGKKKYDSALVFYEKGIEVKPEYPSNYYWAAKLFCNSDDAVWGMLYGEIFLNLERDTKRTNEVSKLLYNTYLRHIRYPRDSTFSVSFSPKQMPNTITINDLGKKRGSFAKTVYEPTIMLSMLNEKEVNLASLCRIRKYFIESYFKTDSYQKYPNVLFDFQYKALRSGYFDAYSHWVLFYGDEEKGKAWTTANKQKWEAFLNWFSKNEWHLDAQYKFSRKQY